MNRQEMMDALFSRDDENEVYGRPHSWNVLLEAIRRQKEEGRGETWVEDDYILWEVGKLTKRNYCMAGRIVGLLQYDQCWPQLNPVSKFGSYAEYRLALRKAIHRNIKNIDFRPEAQRRQITKEKTMEEKYTTSMLSGDPEVKWLYQRSVKCWQFICQRFKDGRCVLVALDQACDEVGWTDLDDDGCVSGGNEGVFVDGGLDWVPDEFWQSLPHEEEFHADVARALGTAFWMSEGELFDLAEEVYRKAGMDTDDIGVCEGLANWAHNTASAWDRQGYVTVEDIRWELKELAAEDRLMRDEQE